MKRQYDMELRIAQRKLRLAKKALVAAKAAANEPLEDDSPRLTRTERRHQTKMAMLPADMICPLCKRVRSALRAWVVHDRARLGKAPCCRKCHAGGK